MIELYHWRASCNQEGAIASGRREEEERSPPFNTHTGRIVAAVRARVPLPRALPEVPPDAPGTLPRQQRAAPERREWLRKLRRAARLFPTNE